MAVKTKRTVKIKKTVTDTKSKMSIAGTKAQFTMVRNQIEKGLKKLENITDQRHSSKSAQIRKIVDTICL